MIPIRTENEYSFAHHAGHWQGQIGDLSEQQRQQAIQFITSSPAPRDGIKRCQDWVYDTLLSLEIEELVPPGTCQFWKGMVGKSAQAVDNDLNRSFVHGALLRFRNTDLRKTDFHSFPTVQNAAEVDARVDTSSFQYYGGAIEHATDEMRDIASSILKLENFG